MPYLQGENPRPEGCLFCQKLKQEDEEAHILYRGDHCFVILNRFPYNNGHLMVVPFDHVGSLEDLDVATQAEMMQVTDLSLRVLRKTYEPDGFNLGMNIGSAAGAGIADHVHLHVVPRWNGDTNYMTVVGHTRTIPEWMEETYDRLRPLFDGFAQSPAT